MSIKEKTKTDNWDKLKILSKIIGFLIIPIAVVIIGNLYSKTLKEKEIQGNYIKIAVEILREEPSKENYNIRDWAIKIINLYSEVKLNDSIQQELKTKTTFPQIPQPVFISGESLTKGDILVELLNNNLLRKICDAKNILKSKSLNSEVEAADIFREVLQKLSPENKLQLDQNLHKEADSDYRNKFYNNAAIKYKVMFNKYYEYCN